MHANTIFANGVELHYVERGAGTPVVLVHGGLQDYRLWEPYMAILSSRFRVIAYSRRYHYPNVWVEDGGSDATGDVHGEDLAALIRGLNLGRPYVVAHSGGALAALFFAAAHPDLVRALVLSEPPATGLLVGAAGGEAVLREFDAMLAPARRAFQSGDLKEGVRLFTDAANGHPGEFEGLAPAARQMAMDNAAERRAWAVSTRAPAVFTCEQARRITAPVLLLKGERSPTLLHRIIGELARCLSNQEQLTIPGAAHTIMRHQPYAYTDAVLTFLLKR